MKEPSRLQKYINIIHTHATILEYEYIHRREYRQMVRDLSELEDYLRELAVDQKIHNIRLSKKLKHLWELGENERIAQKIEKIKDMV